MIDRMIKREKRIPGTEFDMMLNRHFDGRVQLTGRHVCGVLIFLGTRTPGDA